MVYFQYLVLQHELINLHFLLFLKIEYPENVHLIRGNHEAADINALFGFRLECIERMVILTFLYTPHRPKITFLILFSNMFLVLLIVWRTACI